MLQKIAKRRKRNKTIPFSDIMPFSPALRERLLILKEEFDSGLLPQTVYEELCRSAIKEFGDSAYEIISSTPPFTNMHVTEAMVVQPILREHTAPQIVANIPRSPQSTGKLQNTSDSVKTTNSLEHIVTMKHEQTRQPKGKIRRT
jgi:hypothetical protein